MNETRALGLTKEDTTFVLEDYRNGQAIWRSENGYDVNVTNDPENYTGQPYKPFLEEVLDWLFDDYGFFK